MEILSNFVLSLCHTCNQIDIKQFISIHYGRNTIAWAKIRQLRHFIQNVSCQNPYQLQNLNILSTLRGHKNRHGQNFWNFNFFYLTRQSYRYYQEKNQVGPPSIHNQYINLTMKLLIKSQNSPKNRAKNKILHFLGSCISVLLQIDSSSFQASQCSKGCRLTKNQSLIYFGKFIMVVQNC